MNEEIKSGKDVIDEFFSEIYNINNVDEKTVEALVSLYDEGKLTDKNIQNALEALVQQELNPKRKENE
jgi:Glu-tRNA(Gln) amidotransferase subunit E-like FAD-binding protein